MHTGPEDLEDDAPTSAKPEARSADQEPQRDTHRSVVRWVAIAIVALMVLGLAGIVLRSTLREERPAGTVRLAAQAGGLVLVDGKLSPDAVEEQLDQAGRLGLADPQFALYARPGDEADGPYVMFTGGRTDGSDPATAVTEFVGLLARSNAISQVTEHDPGPLGGELRCAGMRAGTGPITLCFWIDDSTTGSIVLADPMADRAGAAELLTGMRADLEHRR